MGTFKTSMSCSHWKHHHLSMYFLCSCFVTGKIHTRLIYNIHFPPCGFLTHPQDVQVSQSRASLPRCLQPLASGRQMSLVQLCPEVVRRHHHYHHHHHHYYEYEWSLAFRQKMIISSAETALGFYPPKFTLEASFCFVGMLRLDQAASFIEASEGPNIRRKRRVCRHTTHHKKKRPQNTQKKTSDLQIMLRKPIWEAEHLAKHCVTVLWQEVCKTLEWMSKQNRVFRNLRF